jgi:hypothetical protein
MSDLTQEETELVELEARTAALKRTIEEKRRIAASREAYDNHMAKLNAYVAEMTPDKLLSMIDTKEAILMQQLKQKLDNYAKSIIDDINEVKQCATREFIDDPTVCYHTQPFTFDELYDGYSSCFEVDIGMHDIICRQCKTKLGNIRFNNGKIKEVHFKNITLDIIFPKDEIILPR